MQVFFTYVWWLLTIHLLCTNPSRKPCFFNKWSFAASCGCVQKTQQTPMTFTGPDWEVGQSGMSGFLEVFGITLNDGLRENAKQGERQDCSKTGKLYSIRQKGWVSQGCLRFIQSRDKEWAPSTAWKVMPTDLQEEHRRKEWTKHRVPAHCCLNSQTSSKKTKVPYLLNVARFA